MNPPTRQRRYCSPLPWRSSLISERSRRKQDSHSSLTSVSSDCRPVLPENLSLLPLPVWKRIIDIAVVLMAVPFVALIVALVFCWIKVVSPGPILFRQTRIGRGGSRFTIYKFRSMHPTADTQVHEAHVERLVRFQQPMVKLDAYGDSRLIRGGILLRTTGLDEIPQLLNVLRCEMSLVGPRPCLPRELEFHHSHHLQRFSVPPGLTGLWQIRRTDSNTFRDMVNMDCDYVKQLAPLQDLRLLLMTPCYLCRQTTALLGWRKTGKRANCGSIGALTIDGDLPI